MANPSPHFSEAEMAQHPAPLRGEAKIAVPGNEGVKVVRSCTIRRPAAELYAFWRSIENVARIVKHPVTIVPVSDIESHWSVSAPGGRRVEWDAVIINDEPNELIAWRSRDGADIRHAGTVRFERETGSDATVVRVQLEYDPPGGKLGALVAKFTGREAGQQVEQALERFKTLMETGTAGRE